MVQIDLDGNEGIPINEFKFEQMVENPAIVMVAKRGSGKSYVCRALMHHFRDIPCGVIISRTDRMNEFYGTFFPSSFIFYEYKTEIIEKIIVRQQMIIQKWKSKGDEWKIKGKEYSKLDPRSFLIMDDCLSQKGSWVKDQPIQELLFNGRHYQIMYVLTMQFPLGITPELRINFDYVFLMAEDTQSNLKRIYDHYAGCFPTFQSFKQVFTELTKDYGCMVLVNRGARSNIFEKIFYYKAPNYGGHSDDVKFGCKQFRDFHEKNFNPKWGEITRGINIEHHMNDIKKTKGELKVNIVNESKK